MELIAILCLNVEDAFRVSGVLAGKGRVIKRISICCFDRCNYLSVELIKTILTGVIGVL